jgi:hypothetical protein
MEKLEISISSKAREVLDELKKGSGYESDDDIIQEIILSMYELIEISKMQEGFGGVLSTFTRFKVRTS